MADQQWGDFEDWGDMEDHFRAQCNRQYGTGMHPKFPGHEHYFSPPYNTMLVKEVPGGEVGEVGNDQSDTSIDEFCRQQSAWSQSVFGTDAERGPIGALKHLAKEAVEAQEKPGDIMEYVDCLFLTIDAARRAGFSWPTLLSAAWDKLEINRKREWGKPTSDEPVEHVREGEA